MRTAARIRATPLWGDFEALRVRHLRRFGIPTPQVIVGGTPCQSFSVAGLRQGLADSRGNLTLAFVRFANAVDNLRRHLGKDGPLVVWENVPGIFSSRDNAFGCFLAGLAGSDRPLVSSRRWTDAGVAAGPTRTVAWRCLDAQYFGLPNAASVKACAGILRRAAKRKRKLPEPLRLALEAVTSLVR